MNKIDDLIALQKLSDAALPNNVRPMMQLSYEAWDDFAAMAGLPTCNVCNHRKVTDEPCFVCAHPDDGFVTVPERRIAVPKMPAPPPPPRAPNRKERRRQKALARTTNKHRGT